MTNFKYARRQATISEIESIGFLVEDGMAKSPDTGAWYDVEDFLVANSAFIDDEEKFGTFLYLDDGLPACERVLVQIA